MCWIKNHQPPAVRQGPRTSAPGPFVSRRSQQVRAQFGRQPLNVVKVYHQQPGELCQLKWIERLLRRYSGKITQAHRAQLKLFSLFRGRQNQVLHK